MKSDEVHKQIQKTRGEIKELSDAAKSSGVSIQDQEAIELEISYKEKEILLLDKQRFKKVIQEVSIDAFKEITSKLLDETFKEFFLHAIFRNEKMSAIIEEVSKDPSKISKYQDYKEFVILFLSKKYRSEKYPKQFKKNHEDWIYETGSKDPFSFENVLELRADLCPKDYQIDPDHIRELLKSLFEMELDELILKYKALKRISGSQEKTDKYCEESVPFGEEGRLHRYGQEEF